MIIFCYGTLKRNFRAHHLLEGSSFIQEATTAPRYHLYHQGFYPGMVEDESFLGPGVTGELYDAPESLLERLDEYEGVGIGLFSRSEIELSDGTHALGYLVTEPSQQLIETGIWE